MIPPIPLAAVLLDLDGTLLDTAPDLALALNTLRAEQQLPALAFQSIAAACLERRQCGRAPRLSGRRCHSVSRPCVRAFCELYRSQLVVETRLFPGFDEVLSELEAHRIPWGVITNKPAG